ncbi:TadE/TadG family type IV pilus assembly protein [Sphingorhabdus sp.]|uniref:TadE/TadG family type IV pilus assembly protein n=1 Tax=Sphingorhabdus sp. TaxID=1902408 RepID=UPI0038FCB524
MIISAIDWLGIFNKDELGASILEFALIAPVAMLLIFGTMDIGHSYFVRATLDGAMQNMGRSSSLESAAILAQQVVIDLRVKEAVLALAPTATITTNRSYYKTFSEAASARAEIVIENPATANFRCDVGESFWDINGNKTWDSDGGAKGQGGARDVVVITYKVTYPRLFPLAKLMGLPANVELESNSILANQPYGEQATNGLPVQINCPAF